MLVRALLTLAADPRPLVSGAFFWKLLSLEGFHPMLDECVRCGAGEGGEEVEFVERLGVEQGLDALASEQLALLVLTLDRAWASGVVGLLFSRLEIAELGVHGVVAHRLDASRQGRFSLRRWSWVRPWWWAERPQRR